MKQIILLLVTVVMFTSCSQNQKENKEEKVQSTATVQDIVVTDNDKAYESKVESSKDDLGEKDKSYYYSYNEKVKDKSEKRTQVDANMHIRSAYEDVKISLMAKKLSKNFTLKCSPCHNDYANGLIGPSLLSRNAKDINSNMLKYKSGEKKSALMAEIIKQISDEEIKALSIEIAEFNDAVAKLKNK